MKKTLVIVAHESIETSSSHQFLISAGRQLSNVDYWLLEDRLEQLQQVQHQRSELLNYERIIFQFQLHWYQAPYLMKQWIDTVFQLDEGFASFKKQLINKELGIVVIAGSAADQYQAGASQKRSMDDLLSVYEVFAHHFKMIYLPAFAIHEFHLMSQEQKQRLLWRYNAYLVTGNQARFSKYQQFIIEQLENLNPKRFEADEADQLLLDMLIETLQDQADELEQLKKLTEDW